MAGLPLDLHVEPDGEQAFEFLKRAEQKPNAPRPHLMLLDLNLPRVDGITLLRKLREREQWRNLPVMVIADAAGLGASYFRKPASYEAFLSLGPILRSFLEDHDLLPEGNQIKYRERDPQLVQLEIFNLSFVLFHGTIGWQKYPGFCAS